MTRALHFVIRLVGRVLGSALLAVYYVVTRAFIAVLALYLTLYFLVGSGPVKLAIQDIVADAIPGTMSAATLQWGPIPWHFRLADARVHGARGEEVIRVRAVEATIDWGATANGLFDYFSDPDTHPFLVHFDRVDLLEPWAHVDVADDADSSVGIERAFVIDDPNAVPDGSAPANLDIRAKVVRVINGGVLVESAGFRLEASGANTVTDFTMLHAGDHMLFDVPRTTIASVVMSFSSFSNLPAPLFVEATDLVVDDFAWRGLGFTWRHVTGLLPGGRFEGQGGLDAADGTTPWFGSGRIWLDADSPIAQTLFRGALEGAFTAAVTGAGNVEQVRGQWSVESPALAIAGLVFEDLFAEGRIEPRGTPFEKRLHAIYVDEATATHNDGRVRLYGVRWEPYRPSSDLEDGPRDLWATVQFTSLDPSLLFAGSFPTWLVGGRATGSAHLAYLPHPHDERLELELEPTTLAFTTSPVPGLADNWTVEGTVRHSLAPRDLTADATAHIPIDERLELIGLQVDAGEVRARLAGVVDLAARTLDVEPYLRLGSIGPIARGLIGRDAVAQADLPAGRLVVKSARLAGPLSNPRLDATINWTQARLGGRDLGQVSGAIALVDGVLSTTDLQTRTPLSSPDAPDANQPRRSTVGRFSIDGRVSLFAPSPPGGGLSAPIPLEHKPFELRIKNIEGLAAAALTPIFGPDAKIAVDQAQLSGLVDDPVASLAGRGRIRVTGASMAGEDNLRLDGQVALEPNLGVSVRDARLTLASGVSWTGDLRLGPERPRSRRPAVTAPDLIGFDARTIEARLELSDTRLSDLGAFAAAVPDLDGVVSGRLSVGGTVGRPSVIGTLAIDQARFASIALGSARLGITTRTAPATPTQAARRLLEVSAFDADFFRGYSLERAQLVLDGNQPRRLELTVRARDKNLGDFVSGFDDATVDVFGTAAADLDLDLDSGLAAIRLRAAPGDVAFVVPERSARWANETDVLLVSDGRTFTLHPLTLTPTSTRPSPGRPNTAPDQRVSTCGSFDPATLALDLQVSANFDIALAPGLSDFFSVTRGRFTTGVDPEATRSVGDDTCLQNMNDFIHISGKADAPVVSGRLDTSGLYLVPRGSGREVRIRDGSAIVLRPGKTPTEQRVELGLGDNRFEGDLDDGSFGLTGTIELSSFLPQSFDLRIVGADIFLQSPGEFAITASPFGRVVATDLMGPVPTLYVSGDLSISEGRFSKSFDTFARAVGGALGVRADAYSTSLLDDIPWLGQTRLDVNVLANDFQIQTALPLARTDLRARLDLTLRGTIAEPRLTRRIDILPGGTLSYFVFERTFIVNQGAIDFDGDPERPLVDVTAQTQITYLQRAQTTLQEEDEKEVGITLRMTGRVPDLKIELSSDDASLDQADIQSLLITGKPRGDLDRAQENQLVSADLANVINSVFAAPFVRRASVGVDQKGGLEYRVGTCFAPGLCFDTTTVSDDTETTLRAKFSLAIGDDVVCEGTLRRSDGAATSSQDTYQARCRYRIPLE